MREREKTHERGCAARYAAGDVPNVRPNVVVNEPRLRSPTAPHTSMTGLNMAASIHVLAALDDPGYFEGDVSKNNLFRDVNWRLYAS